MSMSMPARLCLFSCACIVFVFGALHLFHTFSGKGLWPRDAGVQAAMASTPLRIAPTTTLWRAWIGFNASHALALLCFGLAYGWLALQASGARPPGILALGFGLAFLTVQLVLAWQFWFRVPVAGIALAWLLMAGAIGLFDR